MNESLLNDMALFVEVVKAHGFRAAADVTGIPNSTLSRRVNALEKAVGLRLLHRTTRKIELTEAGRIYYERCRRIVDEAKLAHQQLHEMLAQPSGVLRVSLPVDYAVTYLAPLFAKFAATYPDITFDLDLTSRRVDLVTGTFDVAIRIGDLEDSQLIALPLPSLTAGVYAAPSYLARSGEPGKPADLAHHECFNMTKFDSWTLHNGKKTATVPVSSRFKINNVGMIRRLAALGVGLILMPETIVADDVAKGNLRRILPEWHGAPMPIHAVTETRLLPAKTRCFIDFLRDGLAR